MKNLFILQILFLLLITSEAFPQQGNMSFEIFSGAILNTNSYQFDPVTVTMTLHARMISNPLSTPVFL